MLGYGRATKVENSKNYYLDGFIMDISDRKKWNQKWLRLRKKLKKQQKHEQHF